MSVIGPKLYTFFKPIVRVLDIRDQTYNLYKHLGPIVYFNKNKNIEKKNLREPKTKIYFENKL